jgi:glucose-6-phosphate isomerase
MKINLQDHASAYRQASDASRAAGVLRRIWSRDHTVWALEPDEISNRLGWLDVHVRMQTQVPGLNAFRADLIKEGFTHALLLGMGGSSLAPELFARTFGAAADGLDLAVLDSTDPGAVREKTAYSDPEKTIYIVATKSGGTVETFSFFKYCYNLAVERVGAEAAGRHFIAITDPGSGLVDTAMQYRFRRIFLSDPEIGGRYSALSLFGLVPAALVGADLGRLLAEAETVASVSHTPDCTAVRLGISLGVLAKAGRDKLTLLTSPEIASFGDWIEQLVAESTGKRGRGILPVVGERSGGPSGMDRVFAGHVLPGDAETSRRLNELETAGHPVIRMELRDPYELGGQFFLWEFATAVAGHVLGIQPFDQPNVESAKILARRMVDRYQETGKLPEGERSEVSAAAVERFIGGMVPGEYIAIHAYLAPGEAADRALDDFRIALRAKTGAAVTVGYGPRFLHSTGQLHKGDAGNGRFIQFTAEVESDLPIPDQAGEPASQMSFDTLKLSQALGDYEALQQADPPRKVIRFHLGANPARRIAGLAREIESP